MEKQALIKLMENLLDEINNTDMVDKKDQAFLEHLEAEIRESLDRNEKSGEITHPTTINRLQDDLSRFESSHPDLTLLISQVLEALSGSGI